MNQDTVLSHLNRDPVLKPLTASIEFPQLRPSDDPLAHDLIRAIIYQQLSTKAATTIYKRFLELFPNNKIQTSRIPSMTDEYLRTVGVSRQKAGYVRNIARFFEVAENHKRNWEELDNDHLIKELTTIKGVGVWTVKMVLMGSMGRADIFAPEDLGIQSSMIELYGISSDRKKLAPEMTKIAEAWRPYRTYACHYLWRWKDQPS